MSVLAVIGCGRAGLVDGNFEMAQFHHPQGMALAGETLYVADAENHAIRRVDLARRTVATIAGTGRQARALGQAGRGETTALNSPWDLAAHQGVLYIAMAGSHQVWRMDLATGIVRPHAGVGREARVDGPLPDAALAQPSGLTTDGRQLYVADSESSAIRSVDMDEEGVAETVAGGDLFEFGDRDGQGREVRLQHPLDVTYHRGLLYVADTYNHKIKRLSPEDGVAETLVGAGEPGLRDGARALFHEPSGLCAAGDALYVADTNNHAIRVVDLLTRRVTTARISAH
jgi:sugar lactone lactonase YvrE